MTPRSWKLFGSCGKQDKFYGNPRTVLWYSCCNWKIGRICRDLGCVSICFFQTREFYVNVELSKLAFPPMIAGKFCMRYSQGIHYLRFDSFFKAFGGPTSVKGNTGPFWVSSGKSLFFPLSPRSEMNKKIRSVCSERYCNYFLHETSYARWYG